MRRIAKSRYQRSPDNLEAIRVLQRRLLIKLKAYFPHPRLFLRALADSSGLITGSWALAFMLDRWDWDVKDMDLALPGLNPVVEDHHPLEPRRVTSCPSFLAAS